MKGYSELFNLNDRKLSELRTLVYESEDYDRKRLTQKTLV